MPLASRIAALVILAGIVSSCAATMAYGPAQRALTTRERSLETLDQASQLGSQAE